MNSDDPLQPTDDLFNPSVDGEQLPQDGATPAAPADDVPAGLPDDHPVTDTDVDSQEAYDAGISSVADTPEGSDQQENLSGLQEMSPLEPIDDEEDQQQT
jgi:hypothetical protein